MNRFKLFCCTILSLSTFYGLFAQKATPKTTPKTTQFSVKIEGYTEGVAKLVGIYADANYLADSARIAPDGSFIFKKNDGYQDGLFYVLMPDQANFQFLIANGENNFSIKTAKGKIVLSLTAENSTENQLFFDNQKYQVRLEERFNALLKEQKKYLIGSPRYDSLQKAQENLLVERDLEVTKLKQDFGNAFFTKFKLGGQNPKFRPATLPNGGMDTAATMRNYRDDWWNDVDFSDERIVRTPVFFNKMKKYIEELTPQQPDSIVKYADILIDKTLKNNELFKIASNWIGSKYKPGQTTLMDGEAVYSHLILKYFTPERTDWIPASDLASTRKRAEEMRVSLLGMVGQDVFGQNKEGQTRSLYALNSAYKVVYIYNPDCEHCQEETPRLRAVYDQWKTKGLEVFSIAANAKNKEEWQTFAKNFAVNWTDVWDPQLKSRYHEKYFIDNTPELYLLDKNNKIIAKNLKPNQLPEILTREMGKQ